MKKCWLFVMIAAVMLLVFPAVSFAAGNAQNEVALEGETSEPAPTPTYEPTMEPTQEIRRIDLHPATVEIFVGDYTYLKYGDYNYMDLVFSSSNPSILRCEYDGSIFGLDDGTATVTVMVKETGYYETCSVTVRRVRATSLEFTSDKTTISVGGSSTASIWVQPWQSNRCNSLDFSWSVSDTSIVTIEPCITNNQYDNNGIKYTGINAGIAVITASGDGLCCSLTITVISGEETPVESLKPTATSSGVPRSSAAVVASPTPAPTKPEANTSGSPRPTREPLELDATSWETAEREIAGMEAGSLSSIQMPEDTLVPVSLLRVLKQTQCTLEIDMGGYICTINGRDLSEIPGDIKSVDIGMTMEKDAMLSAACGADAYELRFNYHGQLPGLFTFRIKAEGSQPSDTIYVYYFDEEVGAFLGLQTAVVDDEGYVSFGITHCSSYYVSCSMIAGANNDFSASSGEAERDGLAAFITDNYIGFWVCVYVLGCGTVVTIFVVIFRRRGKRKGNRASNPT